MTKAQINKIEPTSYIWHKLFLVCKLPSDGVVVEVAPGHEPKIGNALALSGFKGKIFIVEPDKKMAALITREYKKILPESEIKAIVKPLQNVDIKVDIPNKVDALVASHPFDDMVISFIVKDPLFFTHEKTNKTSTPDLIKNSYNLTSRDYAYGVKSATETWKRFIKQLKPSYFVASQYPSYTLTIKGLVKRQYSGFAVLGKLKSFFSNSLIKYKPSKISNFKENPKWWIFAKKPYLDLAYNLERPPNAVKRLGQSIFVPQKAKLLNPKEYDVIYKKGLQDMDVGSSFAITLDNKRHYLSKEIITYADRQRDGTDISLSGNIGSGRAVYYGNRFNILGVGKTTLCKSNIPSHSTGKLELIGAMRRLVLSRWINCFTKRAPAHLVLIALKETARYKWNPNPIPLALLVRLDNGSLDRPTHIEYSPQTHVDFKKILTEYAKLDAEYFAYRIILGAWSSGNYSLKGHVIDLESASFVKYRGPYYTSSAKYLHNLFGYEGLGFLNILHQLADIKNIKNIDIKTLFYKERKKHLGRCFLSLIGVENGFINTFFDKHENLVIKLSKQFEKLSKKTALFDANKLNLYLPITGEEDPTLLDMSKLFRNLARLYRTNPNAEKAAFSYLVRKVAISKILKSQYKSNRMIITEDKSNGFLSEVRGFIHSLFELLRVLDCEGYTTQKNDWESRLQFINQDLPNMFDLNKILVLLAESYRIGEIGPEILSLKINTLCNLPNLAPK